MTDVVTATVVEVPKPERPDLWANLHFDLAIGNFFFFGEVHSTIEEANKASDETRVATVHIPGSASPPAEDAIAELCKPRKPGGHRNHVKIYSTLDGKWVCQQFDIDGRIRFGGEGPDPQSAARACLEAIRKAGG